jgi:hypothetical protein
MTASTLSTVPSMPPMVTSTRRTHSQLYSSVMKVSYIDSSALRSPAALTSSAASRCAVVLGCALVVRKRRWHQVN